MNTQIVEVKGTTYRVNFNNGRLLSVTALIQRTNRFSGETTLVQRRLWSADCEQKMGASVKQAIAAAR